jgi:hypothetical protein
MNLSLVATDTGSTVNGVHELGFQICSGLTEQYRLYDRPSPYSYLQAREVCLPLLAIRWGVLCTLTMLAFG